LALPGMMVGTVEGRFLEMLVFALGARRVLEIGTFSGYSSLAMAAGLAPGGRITTCELDPVHAAEARRNIDDSPYAGSIEVVEGPALDTVAGLAGPFDFVFIDADKRSYPAYFEAVLPKLAPRGVIAADNTLWSGNVVNPGDTSEDTAALRAFNDALASDPRVVCVQLSVRDGITLVRRVDGST
ncbi:MAG TPA: class I SAM-dependent methyltransferase, partial [Acidimicrobiales bacterium]|nr:class I SAM-dependent methyltransferase [Acidimicrobiales bacterium]